jgi:hypothetical protein
VVALLNPATPAFCGLLALPTTAAALPDVELLVPCTAIDDPELTFEEIPFPVVAEFETSKASPEEVLIFTPPKNRPASPPAWLPAMSPAPLGSFVDPPTPKLVGLGWLVRGLTARGLNRCAG